MSIGLTDDKMISLWEELLISEYPKIISPEIISDENIVKRLLFLILSTVNFCSVSLSTLSVEVVILFTGG